MQSSQNWAQATRFPTSIQWEVKAQHMRPFVSTSFPTGVSVGFYELAFSEHGSIIHTIRYTVE